MDVKVWKIFVFLMTIVSAAVIPATASTAAVTDYPTKPPVLISAYSAGGGNDLSARMIGQLSEKYLGKPMVVINRVGGSGIVGATEVVKAAPDGYTLLNVSISQVTLLILRGMATYKTDDLDAIAGVFTAPVMLAVRGDSKYRTPEDVVKACKAQPGVFKVGVSAQGNSVHLAVELLAIKAGIKFTVIPFNGSAESIAALLGGHIDATTLDPPGEAAQYFEKGEFRPLLVFEEKRLANFPDVPTARESGYEVVVRAWAGIAGPKGIPTAVKAKLSGAIESISKDQSFQKFLKDGHFVPMYMNGEDFKALWLRDQANFKPVLETLGLIKK